MKKGIVVVSFGTSFESVRKKCIEPTEALIKEKYPECKVVRAFTSNMIIKKLKTRDGITIFTPGEAILSLVEEGISEIHVQPLHIIPGFEYEKVKKAVAIANHNKGIEVTLGEPLLYRENHYDELIGAMADRMPLEKDGHAIVFMGHGTEHFANACYIQIQAKFNDVRDDVFIANVEGYPELDHIIDKLTIYKHITLMPLMLVAGDHAINDMAGDEEDSFKSILESHGIEVTCLLEGLGENSKVREIFANRIPF